MKEFEVTCITKHSRESKHERITHIGNNAAGWCMTREVAIQRIDSKSESYYTVDRATGKRAYIGVVREDGKAPYLRTHADGKWNDNLLAQPECQNCKVL